ncbi:MAG: 23S rRNA (pseudouridine(1915)-N(3))-methyltransferase RlmH [Thermacetogeniaceae bacterium]
MRISIVAVGRVKEPGYIMAQEEYVKRLQRYTHLEIIEVDNEPVPSGDRERQAVKLREGERLQRRLSDSCQQVALDLQGARFTSEELAAWLGQQQQVLAGCPPQGARQGKGEISFIIGGTLGLSPAILDQAHMCLSLSTFTFPHQLARVILLEQLYRAYRILRQEPYHY